MALNSEVHPNVPTIDELKMEEERMKVEEERRNYAWEAMRLKPTVDQINKMHWFPVCHKWCGIGESLGISKEAMEEIIRTDGLLPGNGRYSRCDIHTRCIKAMLIKWLRKDPGTGNSQRTWITIATVVKDVGLGEVVFELLEEALKKREILYDFPLRCSILERKPTLKDIKETIVHHLGEEWHSVGDSLGISSKVMKEVGSKFGSVPTQCSKAMFSKWLNHEKGTGDKERTWGTVLTALEDAGRGDLAISVLVELMVKYKEEEALKEAPDIEEIKVLVIPHVARMWRAIGRSLGIIKAILTAIESEARKKVSLKQSCEMFQLWLDGREGTGDEDRSWLVILRVLVDIGQSDIIFEIQEHFDLKTKDIDQAQSLLCENIQSSSDDIMPVPNTSTPVPTSQGCCSKSLSESSGSEVYTDPLPQLGGKRSYSERSMGESSHATVEESSSTHHPPQSNGDHFTWSEPKRRHLEEGLDKRGKFPSNQPAGSRRRQKRKKLNGLQNKLGLDKRRQEKCSVTFDLRGTLKRRKKKSRRCLFKKSGHSRRHHPDQPGVSGLKRSPPRHSTSGDMEESGHKKRPYDNVSVNVVVQKITRKKLHGGIMGMLNGQRIRLLCDDCKLINRKCKNIILGFEKKNDIEEAADELIDYFQKTHTGEELLMFARFLRKEAEDDGQNPQLLNLAKSIEDAVYTAFHENQ